MTATQPAPESGERTGRTLAEAMGMTDAEVAELRERLRGDLKRIDDAERQAHFDAAGVWLR